MFCFCAARTAAECRRGMVLVSVCMLEEEKSFSYISREAERAELVTEGNILHRHQNCFIGEVTRRDSSGLWLAADHGHCRGARIRMGTTVVIKAFGIWWYKIVIHTFKCSNLQFKQGHFLLDKCSVVTAGGYSVAKLATCHCISFYFI